MARDPTFQPSIWLGCHTCLQKTFAESPRHGNLWIVDSFSADPVSQDKDLWENDSLQLIQADPALLWILAASQYPSLSEQAITSLLFVSSPPIYVSHTFPLWLSKKGANWQQLWKLLCVSAHHTTTWSHYMTEANSSVLLWEIVFCYVFLTFGKVVFRNLWCF